MKDRAMMRCRKCGLNLGRGPCTDLLCAECAGEEPAMPTIPERIEAVEEAAELVAQNRAVWGGFACVCADHAPALAAECRRLADENIISQVIVIKTKFAYAG